MPNTLPSITQKFLEKPMMLLVAYNFSLSGCIMAWQEVFSWFLEVFTRRWCTYRLCLVNIQCVHSHFPFPWTVMMLRTNFQFTCLFVHLGSLPLFVCTDVKPRPGSERLQIPHYPHFKDLLPDGALPLSTLQSDISEDSGLHTVAAVLLERPSLYQTACSACVHTISASSCHPCLPAPCLPWCSFPPFPGAPVLLKNPGNFACCIFSPSFCLFFLFFN